MRTLDSFPQNVERKEKNQNSICTSAACAVYLRLSLSFSTSRVSSGHLGESGGDEELIGS